MDELKFKERQEATKEYVSGLRVIGVIEEG